MNLPERIIDLHTHLFNARYVPLANVIANAMNRDESVLGTLVARLLEELTGSSYEKSSYNESFYEDLLPQAVVDPLDKDVLDESLLKSIWKITRQEVFFITGVPDIMNKGGSIIESKFLTDPTFESLCSSELMKAIKDLSKVDFIAEGWTGKLPPNYVSVVPYENLDQSLPFGEFLKWFENTEKTTLWVLKELMDPESWGKVENYLEFFLTMLLSEKAMLDHLFAGYGGGLPMLQISHYMMDMEMAYMIQKSPRYPFYPKQIDYMQKLQQDNQSRMFGFSAFDPRREDWKNRADYALEQGFVGFKFYPAMGYKPTGNKEKQIQDRIDDFFDFCKDKDVAIFAHCTPTGFQTLKHEGLNAHPKYWHTVLAVDKWKKLRLCLGHAGGERMQNQDVNSHKVVKSPGWMAKSDNEWNEPDNFARIVTELCTSYPNVYCEVGYILPLLEADNLEIFIANIERARKAARELKRPYDLMDKLAYGSDWHMPSMVDNTRKYLNVFLDIMNREAYRDYLDKFFWRNAKNFLKLDS